MATLLPLIGHIQIADVPGRNEPGTGELNWSYIFGRIDRLGYDGWIGCEYRPAAARRSTGLAGWQPPSARRARTRESRRSNNTRPCKVNAHG